MAYFTVEECLTIIAHYECEQKKKNRVYCEPGHLIGSHKYSYKQLLAITNRIIEEMGFDWLVEDVWVREEIKRIEAKLCSFDTNWVLSPYYKYSPNRKPLPPNAEEIKQRLIQRRNFLREKLQKRQQVQQKRQTANKAS